MRCARDVGAMVAVEMVRLSQTYQKPDRQGGPVSAPTSHVCATRYGHVRLKPDRQGEGQCRQTYVASARQGPSGLSRNRKSNLTRQSYKFAY
jgi:hypothetical protein